MPQYWSRSYSVPIATVVPQLSGLRPFSHTVLEMLTLSGVLERRLPEPHTHHAAGRNEQWSRMPPSQPSNIPPQF